MAATGLIGNRCGDSTQSTGTGNLNLDNSAPAGYGPLQTPQSTFATGTIVDYFLQDVNGTAWEVGVGTLTTGTPWTLSRTDANVLESTNSDNRISLTSGTHKVFCQPHADRLNAFALPLEAEQTPTGNPTFTWNRTMPIGLGSLTGASVCTITTPPFVGARARIQITTGSSTDGEELQIIGDTGINVGGAGAATEWSKVFIAQETVTLYARSLTEIDIEYDGRIPSTATMTKTSDQTSFGTAIAQVTWQTLSATSVGNIGVVANDEVVVRRDGRYNCGLTVTPESDSPLSDGGTLHALLYDAGGVTSWRRDYKRAGSASQYQGASINATLDLVDGDTIETWVQLAFSGTDTITSSSAYTYFTVTEVL